MNSTNRQLQLQQYLDQQLKHFAQIQQPILPQPLTTFDQIQTKLQNIQNRLITLKDQAQFSYKTNGQQQIYRTLDRKDKTSAVSLHSKTKKSSLRKTPSKLQKQSHLTPPQKRHFSLKITNENKMIIASPKPDIKTGIQSQPVSTLKKVSRQKTTARRKFLSNSKQRISQSRALQYNLKQTNYRTVHQSNQLTLQRQINECHKSNAQLKKKMLQLKMYETSYLTLRKVFDSCERNRKKRLFS